MKKSEENATNVEVLRALFTMQSAVDELIALYFTDHSAVVQTRWAAKESALVDFGDSLTIVENELYDCERRYTRAIAELDAITKEK